MISYPEPLNELIELLKNLPGVGKRSAERMALAIYKWDDARLCALSENLSSLHERVIPCRECGNFADQSESGLCPVCQSPARDRSCLCIVEEATQIRTIESAGVFRGVYHVLGGRLAPLEGKTAEMLSIPLLEDRIDRGEIREIILALSPDVEGQATAVYLADRLKNRAGGNDLKISRPARGLPAGSDLSYADPATIAMALSGRVFF